VTIFTSVFAIGDELEGTGATEGFGEVMLELLIGEVSCLITAPDQVVTRLGLGIEVVHECPQSASDLVANNRISDLPADRVGHGNFRSGSGVLDETDP